MKSVHYSKWLALVLGGALLPAVSAVAQIKPLAPPAVNAGKAVTNAKPGPATNAAPVELPIPQSYFEFSNVGVKDPFFPASPRLAMPVATNSVSTAVGVSAFQLKALTGVGKDRLATINNRTLAAGEEGKVETVNGVVKVQCVEIRDNTVVLRVQNQPDLIEIRFRKGF